MRRRGGASDQRLDVIQGQRRSATDAGERPAASQAGRAAAPARRTLHALPPLGRSPPRFKGTEQAQPDAVTTPAETGVGATVAALAIATRVGCPKTRSAHAGDTGLDAQARP